MKIIIVAVAWIGLFASEGIGQELYVQSTVAPLWTAPNGHASPVGVLSQGMRVQQLKDREHWCYVRHNNQHGWILKMRLGKMDPRNGTTIDVSNSVSKTPAQARQITSRNSVNMPTQNHARSDANDQIWHLFKAFSW
jgi:hypothetical protein